MHDITRVDTAPWVRNGFIHVAIVGYKATTFQLICGSKPWKKTCLWSCSRTELHWELDVISESSAYGICSEKYKGAIYMYK